MVASREFREDLYYRLAVFPIQLPPLRERREDIPLLVEYFVARYARRMKKRIKEIPTPALQAMTEWPWPGNIRELQNFIERAVILTAGECLEVPLEELKLAACRTNFDAKKPEPSTCGKLSARRSWKP